MPGWTPEQARAAAERSAEVRRQQAEARAKMSPEQRVKQIAVDATEQAVKDLVSAAQGTGDFMGLTKEKRLDALKLVLAYGIGPPPKNPRPSQHPDADDDDEGTASLV